MATSANRTFLELKAGRAFRRGDTNFVDPNPTKGAIHLTREDDLIHFKWRNRDTKVFEEDLIMFPGDAQFLPVPAVGGRVYVLKFSSSSDRHFFWLQNPSDARDKEFVNNLNALLSDADRIPIWTAHSGLATQSASGSNASASGSSGVPQATSEQVERLRSVLASMGSNASAQAVPDLSLTDVLTPSVLLPLFQSHPELVPTLFPSLPSDLPSPPTVETLERVVSSSQFRSQVRSFDRALRTGMLGDLVRGLGLPEEAGTGVEPFLRAVAEQARSRGEERMDTD